jgi:hypothetical protein
MTKVHYPLRVYALVALLGVATLVYGVSRLAEAKQYRDPYPFRTQYARLREVKAQVAGQRMIGYLSNTAPDGRGGSRLYFPTQYVMAPTLLVPIEDKPEVEWVLGNFTRQEDFRAAGLAHGLEVVKEYPMGVVLYRKVAVAPQAASKP